MPCQICLNTGHSAAEYLHKPHYDFQPPTQEEPQAINASFYSQSTATSIPTASTFVFSHSSSSIEISNGNASCSATSVSSERSEWQHEFLKQLAALSIQGTKQFMSTPLNKTTQYCRQTYHPSRLCHSLSLISPG